MYPCLMVFASIQVLIVIQSEAKDLVDMIAPYGMYDTKFQRFHGFLPETSEWQFG